MSMVLMLRDIGTKTRRPETGWSCLAGAMLRNISKESQATRDCLELLVSRKAFCPYRL